jgi:hypothetical protein
MNHSPPLFICSSPGPDPYCSNENVYEELEHSGGDENFIMNNVTMSEAGFIADTSSLPEENHHKNIKEAFDKQDTLRSSINNKLNSHHNTSSTHRNSNNFSRFSKFNTERLLNRNSQHKRSHHDPYNIKSTINGESSSCSSGFYGEHGYNKTKGFDRNKVMNDVIDNDAGSKKVNEFERLIQIRKSVKNSLPNSTPMFNDFEMPYHPPKVNANFYVQSHDMMSNRRNRYRTMDHHQDRSLKGRDYFLNHNKVSHSHDQYNNNDEGNIEVFQPHEILSEFSTFSNLKSEQPIYNNSAALSSDSGYSQNTNTLSEGTLGNQSQRNSNGNIFILSSVLNSESSHATDSIS